MLRNGWRGGLARIDRVRFVILVHAQPFDERQGADR
eukprot:CAMPEP_0198538946 /NCGR_PEP_ID=MMETSP1462-20131121/48145_1 /TAXON_ID=1333877 /ORGANISM="Brandtodinium nutriculum, Strain RCC3387" /LENGTH=35 /DNA_ID= /DNA_START= /DNA_END= /DNA_ORIENTATION=